MRTARIVPLIGRHGAPRGDRAQFHVRHDVIVEAQRGAFGAVHAGLLGYADVGDGHAIAAADRYQRRKRGNHARGHLVAVGRDLASVATGRLLGL
jgi:hypothetical protein